MSEELTSVAGDWREDRRLQAWELHQRGLSQHQIAKALGVTQGAVSQWFARVGEGNNLERLRRQPPPGRSTKLTPQQLAQLPALLEQGAKAFGFETDKWTTRRLAPVLKEVYGVSYHPAHLSRLLRKYHPHWRAGKLL